MLRHALRASRLATTSRQTLPSSLTIATRRQFSELPAQSAFLFAKEAGKDTQKFDDKGRPIANEKKGEEKDAQAIPIGLDDFFGGMLGKAKAGVAKSLDPNNKGLTGGSGGGGGDKGDKDAPTPQGPSTASILATVSPPIVPARCAELTEAVSCSPSSSTSSTASRPAVIQPPAKSPGKSSTLRSFPRDS